MRARALNESRERNERRREEKPIVGETRADTLFSRRQEKPVLGQEVDWAVFQDLEQMGLDIGLMEEIVTRSVEDVVFAKKVERVLKMGYPRFCR